MPIFQDKATLIANRLVTVEGLDKQAVGSGPFIQFLTQLLQQLLPMLLSCLPVPPAGGAIPAAQVLVAMKKLSRVQQWMLRYRVYQAVTDPMDPSAQTYLGAPIIRQIGWMITSNCTEADVAAAMQEIS